MQKISMLFFITVSVLSCKKELSVENRNSFLGDTIQTKSGLKYYYLKKGHGRAIEEGSKVQVYTDLYLNDSDSVFWTTSTADDSLFTFYHKKTSLITGFSELHDYLVAGDEVIAYLPDSIAYGKEGRNGVPAAATLVYNPLIVKLVSEPKILLSDSLNTLVRSEGVDFATNFYDDIMSTDAQNEYFTNSDLILSNLIGQLDKDSLYVESEALSVFFTSKTEDDNILRGLAFYASNAAEAQGNFEKAITYLQPWAKKEPDQPWWQNRIDELKSKLEN